MSPAPLPAPEDGLNVLSFVPAPGRPIATESLIRLVGAMSLVAIPTCLYAVTRRTLPVAAVSATRRERGTCGPS